MIPKETFSRLKKVLIFAYKIYKRTWPDVTVPVKQQLKLYSRLIKKESLVAGLCHSLGLPEEPLSEVLNFVPVHFL